MEEFKDLLNIPITFLLYKTVIRNKNLFERYKISQSSLLYSLRKILEVYSACYLFLYDH